MCGGAHGFKCRLIIQSQDVCVGSIHSHVSNPELGAYWAAALGADSIHLHMMRYASLDTYLLYLTFSSMTHIDKVSVSIHFQ